MANKDQLLKELARSVVDMDEEKARAAARAALQANISAMESVSQGLSQGMREVGRLWNAMEIFMPEVTAACDAYYAGLEVLTPTMEKELSDADFIATAVFGTIYGDVHSVGKDVVIPVFRAEGFKVIDLGVDIPADRYVAAVKEHKATIVGLGTYMGETFSHVPDVIQAFKDHSIRDNLIIVCGGPAADDRAAKEMGADGGFDDAWVAVEAVKKMVAARR